MTRTITGLLAFVFLLATTGCGSLPRCASSPRSGGPFRPGSKIASQHVISQGPYLYSIAYSTATGVTDGTTSLACTAASNPGYWNVLQNSQQSMATTLSTASTISLDVYPSFFSGVSGSSYALVTLYLNGSGIDYQTLDWGTLKVNQENTVTWTLTAAQQAGIAASIGTGQWFQVGIIINTNNPLTAYFDNFRVTSGSGSAPPTPPETNPSLDIAVSTISTASASFTTSIGPYTAEVISLTKSAITTQPSDQYAAVGGSVTFSVTASGSSTLSYQWNFNGTPIAGATGSSYTISNVSASNAGPYTVTVTDAAGSVTSSTANLYVNTGSSGARLINISTRAQVGTGANILIPGFVIGGSGTETLLIRADGPGLTQFNVTGVLAQPILTVFNSAGTAVASNTGWGTNLNPSQIASVAAQVGAFALAPNSADCALIANLGPGSYTVQVSGVGNTTGVALAEVYEVSSTGTSLINISTRAQVGTGGNILIPGFVIGGSGTMQLLVRGDGPGLTQFNVTGVLAQPSLGVFNSIGTEIASNTGWGTASNPSQIASVATFVGAFALTPGSADCAQIVNLQPGGYTIQISGVNSTTGVALAEVYAVP